MQTASPKILFDPSKRTQKLERARRLNDKGAGFLAEIAAETLADRMSAILREFPKALDLFSHFDHMQEKLETTVSSGNVERHGGLTLYPEEQPASQYETDGTLPFEPNSVDLVTSLFGLHWRNDLPATLQQICTMLVPDGLFLAALPGDRTLQELRSCLIEAESRLKGSASLRIDPLGEVRQYGDLLQRCGFALPVVDSELITVRYRSLQALVRDLRAMGGTSCLKQQSPVPLTRDMLQLAETLYFEKHGDEDGKIRASFEIVYLLGWKPHASQQRPLKPGSAKQSLTQVLKTLPNKK